MPPHIPTPSDLSAVTTLVKSSGAPITEQNNLLKALDNTASTVKIQECASVLAAHEKRTYRLFGDFWLTSPESHLHQHALQRLRQLEPHFRKLESRSKPECQTPEGYALKLSEGFRKFQDLESQSWAYPRRKDELVPPSGLLTWPIAHHLHNPSFQSLTPHEGETEDATNSCVWMIIANTFVRGKTLIFDHISRREIVDGLEMYPQNILKCHETWLSKIRSNMAAKVEIIYGKKVRERMLRIYDLEPLPLWGKYEGIVLYLEWNPNDTMTERTFVRFIVAAYHPQTFLCPGGARYSTRQDTVLRIAHELVGMIYNDGFYKNFDTSMINKSGVRPHHYAKSNELAIVAKKELERNLTVMDNLRMLRPITPAKLPPDNKEIERFNKTRVAQKFMMDPAKPSIIKVKCKICGLSDKDYRPIWCRKSGRYVARRKSCRSAECKGQLTIPQDPLLKYICYTGIKAESLALEGTSTQHSPHITSTRQEVLQLPFKRSAPDDLPEPTRLLSSTHPAELSTPPSSKHLAVPSRLPARRESTARKGYNLREASQMSQIGDKGPYEYWHGRLPVMNQMGRVRIWVLRDNHSAAMKVQRVDFSTYGPYLLEPGERILDFNDRGISLISPEGIELWHASQDQLRSRKNGRDIVEQHRRELEHQRRSVNEYSVVQDLT